MLTQEARQLLAEQQAAACPSSSSGSSRFGYSRNEEQKDSDSGATPARALLSEVSVQFLPQVRSLPISTRASALSPVPFSPATCMHACTHLSIPPQIQHRSATWR